MSIFLLFLFVLPVFGQKEVAVLVDSDSTDPNYFRSISFKYNLKKNGNNYVSSVSHLIPPSSAYPFNALSYSILPSGARVDSPSLQLTTNSTAISLDVTFTADQLKDGYGCETIKKDENYFLTVCKLSLEYRSPDKKILYVQLNYTFGLMVATSLESGGSFGISPMLENGCNCSLVYNVSAKLELFTDEECSVPFAEGSAIEYGNTVCLKMHSDDEWASNYYFATTKLILQYTNAEKTVKEMDVTSIAKISFGRPVQKATSYVIIGIPVVGKLKFSQVVAFVKEIGGNDGLSDEGFRLDGEDLRGMENAYGSIESIEKSNAFRAFSITTLMLLLGLIVL